MADRPVLREVGEDWRQGRARWWRAEGAGYTDDITEAGLYERCGYGERGEPGRCAEVDAVLAWWSALDAQGGDRG